MSNSYDFWDSAKNKFSSKVKRFRFPKFYLHKKYFDIWRILTAAIKSFFKRLLRLPKVFNRNDKIALIILFATLLGLTGYKIDRDFLAKTKRVPAVGGSYSEVLIGEARYLNPVLAKSETDKTISRLIYSGLSRIDEKGQLVPDLAHDWEITPDGKTYTFHLRPGIFWHDNQEFSSADVLATIEAIKNENIKSPYYSSWKDVTVEAVDKDTVKFILKDSYGPFIYNTLVGIIPAHIDSSLISSSPIGTGQYKFAKVVSGKNNKIKEVILERNADYYNKKPFISQISFQIAENEEEARKIFNFRGVKAVAGITVEAKEVMNYSFLTSRYFGLIFNLRDDKFKDEGTRKKLAAVAKDSNSGEKFEPEFEFRLLILDKPLHQAQALEIKNNLEKFGVKVEIDKKNAIEYQNVLEKRAFQAVLYGFDSGYDRDPYEFWHSSQINTGLNLAGFSDKNADILLEDARMTVEDAVRNQKYDQFFAILADKAPVIFYPNQNFAFSIKDGIKGIDKIIGQEPWDHLNAITDWYIKTKRVKP